MSRRSNLPPIDPTDLRDHADGERVDRIWARLERNLPSPERVQRRPRGTTVALLAAALGAFAGGVVVGRFVYDREAIGPAPIASIPHDQPETNVFAAGIQARTFPLPGGGQVHLGPGATVELERTEGELLKLHLLQGRAEISAEQRSAGLTVMAGEARLTSPVGSVVVVQRQAGAGVMNVRVQSGVVAIVAPELTDGRLEAGDSEMPVRLHRSVSAVAPAPVHRREPIAPVTTADPSVEPAPIAVAPSWQSRMAAYDYPGALKLLREQPGGIVAAINSARTAGELMNIAEVAHGDYNAQILAYTKVLEQFPRDKNAGFASRRLAYIFDKKAEKGDPDAARLAEMYRERTKQLDEKLSPFEICKQLRNAAKGNKTEEMKRHAEDYLRLDPNGDCREDAKRAIDGEALDADDGPQGEPEPPKAAVSPSPSVSPAPSASVSPAAPPSATPAAAPKK